MVTRTADSVEKAEPAHDAPISIPIPKSVPVPSFYVATFALGVLIGMGIALYWRP